MLAFALFISIFSTVLWLIYSLIYIGNNIGDMSFSMLGMVDMLTYVGVVIFPIFVIWLIFGYINQFLTNKNVQTNLSVLFKQMKKNQDYTDLIARIMLEAEQSIKDGFVLNKFDLFIADMNELLSEIIYRCNLSSNEQIENIWKKVNNGGKWAFGKVIVEINSTQDNFKQRILNRSKLDKVLAGTILEFCARYLSLLALLEKHDRERVFLTMIETGVFGKVFSILAPVSDEIRKSREYAPQQSRVQEELSTKISEDTPPRSSVYPPEIEMGRTPETFKEKIKGTFKKKEEPAFESSIEPERDAFSIALERSFGSSVKDEPKFEISIPEIEEVDEDEGMPKLVMAIDDMRQDLNPDAEQEIETGVRIQAEETTSTNTQKALDNLKKEWEDIKAFEPAKEVPKTEEPKRKEVVEESLSYPFSGWVNEENYKR